MKIVVIGGTGLIGSKLVNKFRDSGHDVIAASPSLGVNTVTAEGLDVALAGAQVVVDASNSPQFDDRAVVQFFEMSGQNLLAAEHRAGVKHHVVLSVVGADRLEQSGYFRAKLMQEELVKKSGLEFSIVRSTQFFEFLGTIADAGTSADSIQLPPVAFQPVAADDVVSVLAEVSLGTPLNGTIEIAGPERSNLPELLHLYLAARNDSRKVVANINSHYFGANVDDRSLVPAPDAHMGSTDFDMWIRDLLR